jgi:outer membrane murein-binding lipoprotein Lpp
MLTWLAAKVWMTSTWKSIISWCKERWELLVGVLVGVLGVFAITGSSRDAKKVLEKKTALMNTLLDAEVTASEQEREAMKRNLEAFLTTNEQANDDFEKKLASLDSEKRKRIREILVLESPEDEIALKLGEYLD